MSSAVANTALFLLLNVHVSVEFIFYFVFKFGGHRLDVPQDIGFATAWSLVTRCLCKPILSQKRCALHPGNDVASGQGIPTGVVKSIVCINLTIEGWVLLWVNNGDIFIFVVVFLESCLLCSRFLVIDGQFHCHTMKRGLFTTILLGWFGRIL